jgi:EEF1A lysine methyltransferase 4
MALAGFTDITNVDYSPVCINQLLRSGAKGACKYQVADCRSMPEFPDGSFASVIDKGTLDSILCSSNSDANATNIVLEVARVLRPGGTFVLITYGHPRSRLRHLDTHGIDWIIQTFTAKRLALEDAADAINGEGTVGVHVVGPVLDQTSLNALDLEDNRLFIYVCQKSIIVNSG